MHDERFDRVPIGHHHSMHPLGHIELGHTAGYANIFGTIFRFKNALVGYDVRRIIARHAVAIGHPNARIHIHIHSRRRHLHSINVQSETRTFRLVVETIDRLHALGHRKRRGAVDVFMNHRLIGIDKRLQTTGISIAQFSVVAIVFIDRIRLETHPVRRVELSHVAGNNHMSAGRYRIVIGNAGIAFFPPLQKRIQVPLVIDVAVASQKRLLGIYAEKIDGQEYALGL